MTHWVASENPLHATMDLWPDSLHGASPLSVPRTDVDTTLGDTQEMISHSCQARNQGPP